MTGQIPRQRSECGICRKTRAGVHPIWGITPVCAESKCELAAQAKDLDVRNPDQLAIGPGIPRYTWYCGAVVAYEGDNKWSIGFVLDQSPERKTEWVRGLLFDDMLDVLTETRRHIMRKTEREILDTVQTEGPH